MSAKDVDRSQKPEGKLESRREFVRTNLGRIVAAAAVAGGINGAAKGFTTGHSNWSGHENYWHNEPVEPDENHNPNGHVNGPLFHSDDSTHTDVYGHINHTDQGQHSDGSTHTNYGS
jgi:hypothetical protein